MAAALVTDSVMRPRVSLPTWIVGQGARTTPRDPAVRTWAERLVRDSATGTLGSLPVRACVGAFAHTPISASLDS